MIQKLRLISAYPAVILALPLRVREILACLCLMLTPIGTASAGPSLADFWNGQAVFVPEEGAVFGDTFRLMNGTFVFACLLRPFRAFQYWTSRTQGDALGLHVTAPLGRRDRTRGEQRSRATCVEQRGPTRRTGACGRYSRYVSCPTARRALEP